MNRPPENLILNIIHMISIFSWFYFLNGPQVTGTIHHVNNTRELMLWIEPFAIYIGILVAVIPCSIKPRNNMSRALLATLLIKLTDLGAILLKMSRSKLKSNKNDNLLSLSFYWIFAYIMSAVLSQLWSSIFNTLRSRQNGSHFAYDIFERIFMNENVWSSLKISLKFVIDNGLVPFRRQAVIWTNDG